MELAEWSSMFQMKQWFLHKFQCILMQAAFAVLCSLGEQISVQKGDLSQVDSTSALISMSGDSLKKEVWWHFLESDKPEAFLSYLVLSPPFANKPAETEDSPVEEIRRKGGLLATRDAAIAEYHSVEQINSLGTIRIDMWLLSFVCLALHDNPCYSVAPVVLQNASSELQHIHEPQPAFFSVWEVLNSSTITNSLTSKLSNNYALTYANKSGLEFKTSSQLPYCANASHFQLSTVVNEVPDVGYRDFTTKCYQMDEAFKNITGSDVLRVEGDIFLPEKLVGIERCLDSKPLLVTPALGRPQACYYGPNFPSCAEFDCDKTGVKNNLLPYFAAVYEDVRSSLPKPDAYILRNNSCTTKKSVSVKYVFPVLLNAEPVYRRVSSDFCLLGLSDNLASNVFGTVLESFDYLSSRIEIINSFMLQMKSLYIQAHNSILNLEEGPATDFWVAAISVPSAFVSVVAATVPITNVQLRTFPKTYIVLPVNLLLAAISYSAVIALTPVETRRQAKFKSWGLHADEIAGLQVLVVMRGASEYVSNILVLTWVSVVLLLILVAWITLERCNQVFKRRDLLKEFRHLKDDDVPGDETLDYLRAIEMTLVEHKLLEKDLENIKSCESRESRAVETMTVEQRLERTATLISLEERRLQKLLRNHSF